MEASNPAPPKLGYHLEINPTAPAAHHPKPQSSSSRDFQPFGRWIPWLVPSFVVANVVLFVITMYVNDCPENSPSCFAGFLGRFSFQPLKENPLIGPSSSAYVSLVYFVLSYVLSVVFSVRKFIGDVFSFWFFESNCFY